MLGKSNSIGLLETEYEATISLTGKSKIFIEHNCYFCKHKISQISIMWQF